MSVRARYKLGAFVSSTSAEEKDLGKVESEVVVDSQNEGGSWKTTLAAAAVDQQLLLPNVANVRLLAIRTSAKDPTQTPGTVRIRRNLVTAEEIEITPLSTSKEGHFLITTNNLTALYASNPGTVVMDITIVIAGD